MVWGTNEAVHAWALRRLSSACFQHWEANLVVIFPSLFFVPSDMVALSHTPICPKTLGVRPARGQPLQKVKSYMCPNRSQEGTVERLVQD